VAPALDSFGHVAVAVLIMPEDSGVPAPGEIVLFACRAGRLNVVAVGVVAPVAAVAAAVAPGQHRLCDRPLRCRSLVLRFGRYVRLTGTFRQSRRISARRGSKMVITARFAEVLRQLSGIIAGMAGTAWPKFPHRPRQFPHRPRQFPHRPRRAPPPVAAAAPQLTWPLSPDARAFPRGSFIKPQDTERRIPLNGRHTRWIRSLEPQPLLGFTRRP
jgi:hypothetical protein